MSKLYDVTIRLPAAKLALVIETLNGEGDLLSVSQSPIEKPRGKRHVAHRAETRGPGKLNGEKIILECVAGGGDVTYKALGNAYEKHGLMAKSISPMISKLKQAGRIVEVRSHVYKIAPKA